MQAQWLVLFSVLLFGGPLLLLSLLPVCPSAPDLDIFDAPTQVPLGGTGLHVVVQTPLLAQGQGPRQREFYVVLEANLRHPHVAMVHVLTESVAHQEALYQAVPVHLHDHLRTHNIGRRMTYADAVRYANLYLVNTTTLIANADVTVAGPNWELMTVDTLRGYMFGLTRHEQRPCAWQCDCREHWSYCHDSFAFVPPLQGGDEFLEQISFRVGGLWGSENRFMWEVHHHNPHLRIMNPCFTFRTLHWHCQEAGRYRPTQDQRRVNTEGRSLEPWPSRWHPAEQPMVN
jgi:hypothetical protein